jgi:hypothetical protein
MNLPKVLICPVPTPAKRRLGLCLLQLRPSFFFTADGSGSAGSTPDSGPNSPPIGAVVGGTPRSGSGDRTPQHDDGSGGGGGSPYGNSAYGPPSSASVSDLTLYSSPSLPNISLGKPIPPNSVSFKFQVSASTFTNFHSPSPCVYVCTYIRTYMVPYSAYKHCYSAW